MTTILPAVIDRLRKRQVEHPVHAGSDNKKVRVQDDPNESNELRINRNRRLQMHVHENQDQPDHKDYGFRNLRGLVLGGILRMSRGQFCG